MEQTGRTKWDVWVQRAGLGLLGIAVVTYLTSLYLAGGSPLRFLWYGMVFLLLLLPGVRLTELLVPDAKPAEKIIASFSLGLGVLFLSYITLGRLTTPPMWGMLIALLPLSVWQIWAWIKRVRKSGMPKQNLLSAPERAMLLIAFAGGLLVFSFQGVLNYARAGAVGEMTYHQDMMWRTANAAAVQLGSPLVDIQLYGSQLRYHYLGDAISGFGAMFSGVLPYEATCFYTYPFLLFFMVAGLYAAARAYGASVRTSALLPFAVLFANGLRSGVAVDIMLDMNGLATATVLTAAVLVYLFRLEEKSHSVGFYGAFALSTLVLLMSKNLYSMLLTCAVLASILFGLVFQRRFYRNALVAFAIGGGLFVVCWQLVYRFAQQSLEFQIWQSPVALCQDVVRSFPLGAALWLVSVVLCFLNRKELPFSRLVVHAAAIGGLLAYFLYHHYSASQNYFLFAAFLFMWFCALDTEKLWETCQSFRWTGVLLACASVGLTVITLAPMGYEGIQVVRHRYGLRPHYPRTTQTVTAADEATGLWLRDNLEPDEIFATNRNDKDPIEIKEGTWHYLTAVSGRQAYVEGWMYGLTYGHDYHAMRYQLEQVSDGIFACADAETAFSMAREHDIDYLVVTKWLKPELFTGATPVFETEETAVYQVPAE